MVDPVFVQPHFDDVALSCGGTVAKLAEPGSPKIVTVFGGKPEGDTGDFARLLHGEWNLSDVNAVERRREEDRAAAAALGPAVEPVWFDYLDAIYRQPAYSSDEALFGDLVADDLALADEIAARLASLGDLFVLPMAVGNHVDHQLVFSAGGRLLARAKSVWLYADLPYALDERAFRTRLEELGDPTACAANITAAQFERRWDAIQCYASQLPVIFREYDYPRREFERFSSQPGTDGLVEQFWNLEDIGDE